MSDAPTTHDTPLGLEDWRTPKFWVGAIGQLVTFLALFGALTAAEAEQLKDSSAKTLAAAGVIGAQVAVLVALVRQRRGGGPPPADGLPKAAWFGPLLLVAFAGGAAAQEGTASAPAKAWDHGRTDGERRASGRAYSPEKGWYDLPRAVAMQAPT